MPRTRPLTRTRATFDQMAQATNALIQILSGDPRVQAVYARWRSRPRSTTRAALTAAIAQDKASDLAALRRFVRHELHLTHTGLAPLLLAAFAVTFGRELDGQPQNARLVFVPDAPDVPPSDNVVGFVRAEMNAEYRRSTAKNTHESHLRMSQLGHVVGGRVFGYDNVCSGCDRVIPPGKLRCCPGHTERRINEPEAAVIRRTFALYADGTGCTRIAKQLNADGALTPTPRRGQPPGWGPSNVREILRRPLCRGEVIYNQTRRRAPDGTDTFAPRPASEWLRVSRPELRIVSESACAAVDARLAVLPKPAPGRRGGRRRRDIESPYLLSGFARCAQCGGSVGVLDRRQYGCIAFHKPGRRFARMPSSCRSRRWTRQSCSRCAPTCCARKPYSRSSMGCWNCSRRPASRGIGNGASGNWTRWTGKSGT